VARHVHLEGGTSRRRTALPHHHEVVNFYYETLAARLATFEPTSLRLALIQFDEALLHAEARREYMLPATHRRPSERPPLQ
jgi:hypothetical protein